MRNSTFVSPRPVPAPPHKAQSDAFGGGIISIPTKHVGAIAGSPPTGCAPGPRF